MWSATRWQTYNLMQAFCGNKAMNEAGIYKVTDLMKFPWDTKPVTPITKEEKDELIAEMNAINSQIGSSQ